jgi:pyruvate/2-oxoglutarate dehydrogenase complex dihydrolipoamide dehydrogenase (E3) component
MAHDVRRAGDLGVRTSAPTVDLAAVVARKDGLVESIRSGSYRAAGERGDLDLIEGHDRLAASRRLQVDGRIIEADRIFLNTGTHDTIPDIEGIDRVAFHTSRTILDLRQLPEHLIVVGGGFVGCEFAQMFSRFGAHVTVVQRADRLLPAEEPDISAVVEKAFTDELVGSHLLIAAGRTPNSDDLGIEHLGLTPDPSGFLPVDDQLHADAEDVWVLGDLRGGPMFTHTARDDADIAYATVFEGRDRSTTGRVVPHAVFVDPEVASVGLTEAQARAAGHELAVGRQDFSGVAKARAMGTTAGHITFVADADTDRILGCHIVGPDAGNLIHEAVISMVADVPYSDIARAIHVHPPWPRASTPLPAASTDLPATEPADR